jgi:putative heme iron utilization protein
MRSRLEILIDLLHGAGDAALATQSLSMPGFPFASAVPFATDERHRPLLLISRLAEHTQNLNADARASLLLSRPLGDGEMARVTLLGQVAPAEASQELVARYLRYHPEAERFLRLGDFAFHRLEPVRIRVIGGFAQAGWRGIVCSKPRAFPWRTRLNC